MHRKYLSLLALALLLSVLSCNKDELAQPDCQDLQNGIMDSDREQVKIIITDFINNLPSQDYTEENLDRLVSLIEGQCGASVTMECFDCIKTLPSQTEIYIRYPGTNNPVARSVDITYSANSKMKFSNLHE